MKEAGNKIKCKSSLRTPLFLVEGILYLPVLSKTGQVLPRPCDRPIT